jgi:hypothetical protein
LQCRCRRQINNLNIILGFILGRQNLQGISPPAGHRGNSVFCLYVFNGCAGADIAAPASRHKPPQSFPALTFINVNVFRRGNASASSQQKGNHMKVDSIFKITLTVSGLALAAGAATDSGLLAGAFVSTAYAQEDGTGGPDNSKGNQGGQGQGSKGSQGGQSNQGGSGTGQGGPDPDSDSKGPQAGGPADTGSSGGKPAWAQEGIPEVELGRLSVARSPDQVLERAFDEAVATLTPEMIAFYSLDYDAMIEMLSLNWDEVTFIDSPLQNLALMQDALDGTSILVTDSGVTNDNDTLLAVFLGTASDKTVPISVETVVAVSTILGTPITGADAEALADAAEAIRIAILAGHG